MRTDIEGRNPNLKIGKIAMFKTDRNKTTQQKKPRGTGRKMNERGEGESQKRKQAARSRGINEGANARFLRQEYNLGRETIT